MMLFLLIAAWFGTPASAREFADRTATLGWLAERSLTPGAEIDSYTEVGHFVFRDATPDALVFTHPRRGEASTMALVGLANALRASGFSGLRRILVYSGTTRGQLSSVFDLDLDRAYTATNRSVESLRRDSYLRGELDLNRLMKLGGRLLDLGCGEEGRSVRELRDAGIDACGVDPGLRFDLRGDVLRAEPGSHTSFADASVRRIVSSYSVFLYAAESLDALRSTLAECERILEPRGTLVFAGAKNLEALEGLVAERRLLEWVDAYPNRESFGPTVTVRKTNGL